MIYFDTSYIVKSYLPEQGHSHVRRLLDQHGGAGCCALGRLEFILALKRAVREERLPESAIATALAVLGSDDRSGVWTWFPLNTQLLQTAIRIAQALPPAVAIRSLDAMHLVSARENGCTQLFSNDRHMLAAAPHFGVTAVNVIP